MKNYVAIKAVERELSNIEDNLYRFEHFGKPTDLTGNGQTYASVIEGLKQKRRELLDSLAQLETS